MIHKQIKNVYERLTKSRDPQQALLTMLGKCKRALAKEEYVCALFMDHSKATDITDHDLMLTKPKAFEFSINALEPMDTYVKKKKIESSNQ